MEPDRLRTPGPAHSHTVSLPRRFSVTAVDPNDELIGKTEDGEPGRDWVKTTISIAEVTEGYEVEPGAVEEAGPVLHPTPAPSSKPRNGTRRHPEFRVRARAVRAFQRADLLRHDHQPGRRTGAGREATSRDPSPLRPRASGEPVHAARHADDPPHSRAGSRQSRPDSIDPQTGRGGQCPALKPARQVISDPVRSSPGRYPAGRERVGFPAGPGGSRCEGGGRNAP